MPELPEVETVANELRSSIINKKIEYIEALWTRSFDNRSEVDLKDQVVQSISRQGKYLIINLSQSNLIIHLRMTGQLLYYDDESQADFNDYIRVIIKFYDSVLLFKDVRKFGRVYHVESPESFLSHVGPDALDKNMTLSAFRSKLSSSKMNIKAFLLSQKFISGMGNIYTDEALFSARIYPARSADSIQKKKTEQLYVQMHNILKASINNMGSTIADYRDPSGNKGTNQFYFNVYGRAGLPCKVCGTKIKKIRFAGRGTHFCPKCQRA
jgi:formamidopyrimidine-DNA glycosylase